MMTRKLLPLILLPGLLSCAGSAIGPAFGQGPPNFGAPMQPNTPPQQNLNAITASTAHNEIQLQDAVMTSGSPNLSSASAAFTQADVGKSIVVNGAGTSGSDLITTILTVTDANHIVLNANAATTVPWWNIGRTTYAGSATSSYVIGDTLTISGGTSTTAGQVQIASVGVSSATVNAGGSGGTNGNCSVKGTTGATRTGGSYSANTSSYGGGFFTANVTISGGAITAVTSITYDGDYSTPPTSLSAEPVVSNSGCGSITGATLSLVMGPHGLNTTVAGHYTVLPSSPANVTGGSGSGAKLNINVIKSNQAFTATVDKVGGFFAYGTDDTSAINNAISQLDTAGGGTLILPVGRSLVLGAAQIPYTGTNQPTQNTFRITSVGALIGYQTQKGVTYSPGAVLDMHFSGDGGTHVAKIDTRGIGFLEIDHVTLQDYGTDDFLFMQTTNTTVKLHDGQTIGNPTCWQGTCNQNFLGFGSPTSTVLGTNSATAGFQGYGSSVRDWNAEHLAEVFQFYGSANEIQISNIIGGQSDGSFSATRGFYTFYGVSLGTYGNTISGGNCEITGYVYCFVLKSSNGTNNNNTFLNADVSDPSNLGNPNLGAFSFDSNSNSNFILAPHQANAIQGNYIWSAGAVGLGTNTFFGTNNSGGQQPSYFGQNTQFGGIAQHIGLGSGTGCGNISRYTNGTTNIAAMGASSFIHGTSCNNDFEINTTGSGIFHFDINNNEKMQLNANRIIGDVPFNLPRYTVSALPAGSIGDMASVTDATACTSGSTPTGGGSTFCTVAYNGTAWVH